MTHPIAPPDAPTPTHSLTELWEMLHQAFGASGTPDLLTHLLDRMEARS